ncbi:MAG: KOW domain-containing RNA-binding protein [Clostridia bacterium]|nr:KOW domain-containing RNA-binding protein [Clostridia bacterium]
MALKQFDVALSIAGRDTGSLYLVSSVINESHCLVVDGNLKPLNNPKKKNFKHLKVIGNAEEELEGSLENKAGNIDAKIRKILKEFEKGL